MSLVKSVRREAMSYGLWAREKENGQDLNGGGHWGSRFGRSGPVRSAIEICEVEPLLHCQQSCPQHPFWNCVIVVVHSFVFSAHCCPKKFCLVVIVAAGAEGPSRLLSTAKSNNNNNNKPTKSAATTTATATTGSSIGHRTQTSAKSKGSTKSGSVGWSENRGPKMA